MSKRKFNKGDKVIIKELVYERAPLYAGRVGEIICFQTFGSNTEYRVKFDDNEEWWYRATYMELYDSNSYVSTNYSTLTNDDFLI